MGMERIVTFEGPPPAWDSLQRAWTVAGLTVGIRMIDGLPAFPDEVPADGWREVRVGTPSGMITLRQGPGQLAIVVWGNADDQQRQEWDRFTQACAEAVGGTVR